LVRYKPLKVYENHIWKLQGEELNERRSWQLYRRNFYSSKKKPRKKSFEDSHMKEIIAVKLEQDVRLSSACNKIRLSLLKPVGVKVIKRWLVNVTHSLDFPWSSPILVHGTLHAESEKLSEDKRVSQFTITAGNSD